MEDLNSLKKDFEECFEQMKGLVGKSFEIMDRDKGKKDYVTGLWRHYIAEFAAFTFKASERYDNKEVFKAITKTLIFGK